MGNRNYPSKQGLAVLEKIDSLRRANKEGLLLRYVIPNFFGDGSHGKKINLLKQDKILCDLQRRGDIIIDSKECIDNDYIYYLKVLHKFQDDYQDYKKIIDKTDEIKREKDTTIMVLYLDGVGNLWREPKKKYCYNMKEGSDRHKLIRYLAEYKGYHKTSEISSMLEGKDNQSIRTEIGKIRNYAKSMLKVNDKRFLEGKRGSGYRIGLNYKIKIKK